jgi:hypothetical protein
MCYLFPYPEAAMATLDLSWSALESACQQVLLAPKACAASKEQATRMAKPSRPYDNKKRKALATKCPDPV